MHPTNVAIIVSIIVGSALLRNLAHGQLLVSQHAGFVAAPDPSSNLAHQAVILNSQMEAQLPEELHRSNKFYNNPAVAANLARESWLTDKEMPVFERAAEKIPRSEIYKIVKHAGFIRRRRYLY